jgi:hypothetical protein
MDPSHGSGDGAEMRKDLASRQSQLLHIGDLLANTFQLVLEFDNAL